jgi:hypothetical protein
MIQEREFNGSGYSITEYTMSEIIASVYKKMENGYKEGILFIDEFNCASETLAPALLQFLQNKIFGNHKLPKGWVIVVAGNPAEYNKSVKEIDTVTQDRLRILTVKEDLECWEDYASQKGTHPLVLMYLKQCPKDFYIFEKGKNGREIVTPRAWEDMSVTLWSYEKLGFEVTEYVVGEVLQCKRVIRSFMNCYQLYCSIAKNGEIDDIIAGKNLEQHAHKYGNAEFNEKWAIVTTLIERSTSFAAKVKEQKEEDKQGYYHLINTAITNCLKFLDLAFEKGPETEAYLNQLSKNHHLAMTLLHCQNPVYERICSQMIFDHSESRLKKEIKKAI